MATHATTYTVLELVTRVCRRLSLPPPSTLVGSTNKLNLQMLDLIEEVGEDLVSRAVWPQLIREAELTMVASQDDYELPGDFEAFVDDTTWDRTNEWKVHFPASAREWAWRTNGITDVTPWRHLRVRGAGDGQLLVHPTPSTGDAGEILEFEYLSTNWIRPVQWVQSTAYAAASYVWNDGYIFYSAAGGTSGTDNAPTPDDLNDGGITWTLIDGKYTRPLADTDVPLLDQKLVELGLMWLICHRKGFDFALHLARYKKQVKRAMRNIRGAKSIDLKGRRMLGYLGAHSVPDGNWNIT